MMMIWWRTLHRRRCCSVPNLLAAQQLILLLLLLLGERQAVDAQQLWSQISPQPVYGDHVTVSNHLILDESPASWLASLTIQSGGIFEVKQDLQDILLYVDQIVVEENGALRIGNESSPITGSITVHLNGTTKAIEVTNGTLDIFGTTRTPTWTRLAATADNGTNYIQVQGQVDWQDGETIAIASTDFETDNAEVFDISGTPSYNSTLDTTTIHLDASLLVTHYGERQCWSPSGSNQYVCVDEIAEVILLTRNVVIESDGTSATGGVGGHIKCALLDGVRRCSFGYAELHHLGHRGVLGKYPIHWHLSNSQTDSKAVGNSIHHCFNKAIVIHGTNDTLVDSNTVFEIEGHSIYLEDGNERSNTITNNVVMNTRKGFVTDEEKKFPSSYWVSNPENTYVGNVAAGSDYAGFWFHFLSSLDNSIDPEDIECPRYRSLTLFSGNVAHSNFKYGLEVNPTWIPKVDPCDHNGEDAVSVIDNLVVWKNGYDGVTFRGGEIGAIKLQNMVASNNAKFYPTSANLFYHRIDPDLPSGLVGIENAVLVHLSSNAPWRRDPVNNIRRGIHFAPKTDNFYVQNVTFVNYSEEGTALVPYRYGEPHKTSDIGFEIRVEELTFINSPNKIQFRFDNHGIVDDLDGSLTGSPNRVVARTSLLDGSSCTVAPNQTLATYPPVGEQLDDIYHSVELIKCPFEVRRMEGTMEGSDSQEWEATATVSSGPYDVPMHGSKNKYVIDAPTNIDINVTFPDGNDPSEWTLSLGERRYMSSNESVSLYLHFVNDVSATLDVEMDNANCDTTASSQPCPSCFYDSNSMVLHLCFEGQELVVTT